MNKYLYFIFLTLLLSLYSVGFSQTYISGIFYTDGNAYCSGDLDNAGTFINAGGGNFYIGGNITNSGTTAYDGGTLLFVGSSAQSSGGSAVFYTTNVTFNNASGIAVNKCLSVNNTALFTSGLVTTPTGSTEPLEFTSPALPSGTSNTSHVNGYVRKLGTGAFTYPVGDAAMYQQVKVNPTVNTTGMVVKYFPADAGVAPFVTTGTDPVALQYYNHLEYWNIAPVSTATGVVTVFWDAYNNQGIGSPTDLRVAHLRGAQWLNEGILGAGSVSSGSVTSNTLSSWSPFTIGSISSNSPLPITLTRFDALYNSCTISVVWNVQLELDLNHYELEYSVDGLDFIFLERIEPKGNNAAYIFNHNPDTDGLIYYRLKIVNEDASVSYSHLVSQSVSCEEKLQVYPTLTSDMVNIETNNAPVKSYALYDSRGRMIQFSKIESPLVKIHLEKESEGLYYLVINMANGERKNFRIVRVN